MRIENGHLPCACGGSGEGALLQIVLFGYWYSPEPWGLFNTWKKLSFYKCIFQLWKVHSEHYSVSLTYLAPSWCPCLQRVAASQHSASLFKDCIGSSLYCIPRTQTITFHVLIVRFNTHPEIVLITFYSFKNFL